MSSRPYLPFYCADYLADTIHLSTVEHGAYFLLLMAYWQTGKPLPNDDQILASICRVSPYLFKKIKKNLLNFFKIFDKNLIHVRLEVELQEYAEKADAARARAEKGATSRWSKNDRKRMLKACYPESDSGIEQYSVVRTERVQCSTTVAEEDKKNNIIKNNNNSESYNHVRAVNANSNFDAPSVSTVVTSGSSGGSGGTLRDRLFETIGEVWPEKFQEWERKRNFDDVAQLLNFWELSRVEPEDLKHAVNFIKNKFQEKTNRPPQYFERCAVKFARSRQTYGNYQFAEQNKMPDTISDLMNANLSKFRLAAHREVK